MDINMSLIGQMITFAVLVWVSMKFVFPSLNAALDERAKRIADGLAAADQGQAAMVVAEKRAAEALSGAREEASQRVADAEKRAQLVAEEIKANAQAEADAHHCASQGRGRAASDQGPRSTARSGG